MDLTTFLQILAAYFTAYFYPEMDPNLKPKDSSNCLDCRCKQYDFIIVGGGTAGSLIANRLVLENPNWNVLVVEAGGDENYATDTPGLANVPEFVHQYDWGFKTVQQYGACGSTGGTCDYVSGHVIGGTSTISAMGYVRGNPADYDYWASLGNVGWNYSLVLPYFLKTESILIPELGNSPYHNKTGPFPISYGRYNPPVVDDLMEAGREYGMLEVDYNGESQIGIGKAQLTMRPPYRMTTSKVFLNPIRNKSNFVLFRNTEAIKLIFDENNPARVKGVKCVTEDETYTIRVKQEVIISAGVINTPKLLMLSGIGPKRHLQKLGIPVIADRPVGRNFQNHAVVKLRFDVDTSQLNCCTEYTNETIDEYVKKFKGPLSGINYQFAFLKSAYNNQPSVPDVAFRIIVKEEKFNNSPPPNIELTVLNINTKSKGQITLKNRNYFNKPIIDTRTNVYQEDINRMIWGIRAALRYMNTTVLKKYSPKWAAPELTGCEDYDLMSDDYLECYIRYQSRPSWQGVGTARMGPGGDSTAVVDPLLRVHGMENLRVADASIMPSVPHGLMMAPVMMIAEKAAEFIIKAH